MEILKNPELWVLVGFVIFFVLLGRTFWRTIRGTLDGRASRIGDQLAEAVRLREEAQAMLDSYKAKQEQAVKSAEDILSSARDEAERMRQDGEAELKRSLAAREAQAMDRIALAEQNAIQSVMARAVEIAIRAATGLVAQSIDQTAANALVDRAIDDLPIRATV
jgi:F-type H+-transporting ATPase subunit b